MLGTVYRGRDGNVPLIKSIFREPHWLVRVNITVYITVYGTVYSELYSAFLVQS